MPDIAAQIETALAVMQLFDQIKALLPEGVAAIRHYPNATEKRRLNCTCFPIRSANCTRG